MSTNEIRGSDAARNADVAKIDMKLEVVVIPVSDVDRAKEFYERIGWRLNIDRSAGEISAWSSSRRLALAARSISARTSRRPLLVRPRHSWSLRTSWPPGTTWSPPVPRSASSSTTARKAAAAACIPSVSPTARALYSMIPTATSGTCRRSRSGIPSAANLARLPSALSEGSASRSGVPQPVLERVEGSISRTWEN